MINKDLTYKDMLFIINDILRVENNTYKCEIILIPKSLFLSRIENQIFL